MTQRSGGQGLSEGELAADPIEQFDRWFAEALAADLPAPNAMILATSASDGPDARVVLLKAFDQRGFVFYTNLGSAKSRQLAGAPQAAAVFAWLAMQRQVRIRGRVEPVDRQTSAEYFASRPRLAQLGAWASRQSEVLADRGQLEARIARLEERFAGEAVPLPEFWGGFRLRPESVEFWAGRAHRLHDRLRYRTDGERWSIERLAP
jgi:pyridoxamine 5'-phosphate oxidase